MSVSVTLSVRNAHKPQPLLRRVIVYTKTGHSVTRSDFSNCEREKAQIPAVRHVLVLRVVMVVVMGVMFTTMMTMMMMMMAVVMAAVV